MTGKVEGEDAMRDLITVNERLCKVLRFLDRGKGDYSYLVEADGMGYLRSHPADGE